MTDDPYETPATEEPIPEPEISKEEKQWAMFTHLAGFAGLLGIPLLNIVGPLILWVIKKDEMPYVNDQGKEALNFQISFAIYVLVSGLLCFVLIGFVLLPLVVIAWLVFTIIGTINAADGKKYRYPMTIRLVT